MANGSIIPFAVSALQSTKSILELLPVIKKRKKVNQVAVATNS